MKPLSWKDNLVGRPVHKYGHVEEIENTVLLLRLGLPSTLIRHENGAFSKTPVKDGRNEKPALPFSVNLKRFENEATDEIIKGYIIYLPDFNNDIFF